MAIKWIFKHGDEILYVKAEGKDDSIDDAIQYGQAVLIEAVSNGIKKVLCDERDVIYNLSVLDNFKLARTVSEKAPSIARIAIVYNENFTDDADFFETVAFNRGVRIKATTSIEEAREWLLK